MPFPQTGFSDVAETVILLSPQIQALVKCGHASERSNLMGRKHLQDVGDGFTRVRQQAVVQDMPDLNHRRAQQ